MGIGIMVAAALLAAAGAAWVRGRRPEFSVERAVLIRAPAERIYAEIAELRRWEDWGPWDADGKGGRYSGPPAGVGATCHWSMPGGEGSMSVVEAEPPRRVVLALGFGQLGVALRTMRFSLEPAEGGVLLRWGIEGRADGLLGKAIGVFPGFDRFLGDGFAKGLSNLKRRAEDPAVDRRG